MSITININASEVLGNMREITPRIKQALEVIGNHTGQKMETYAKSNAKWQNRTGAARTGLTYNCKWNGDILDISIAHSVDYGLWLEVRTFPYAGNLAILQEARDSQVQPFINMLKQLNL